MKQRLLAIAALALAIATSSGQGPTPDARACGSAEYANLGALNPVEAIVGRMSMTSGDDWDFKDREELRFLAPFRRESPKELETLWSTSYDGVRGKELSTADLDRALAGSDGAKKKEAAERFVKAWLALPPTAAMKQKPALLRAAAAIDASAAAELFAIEQAIVRGIPDGWRDTVKRSFSPAAAQPLERKIDDWIALHPSHPLREYAALWKVRVRYFSGDDAGAYDVVLRASPASRVRALAEARYLLLRDVRPTKKQIDAQADVAWIAGFADRTTLDDVRFARWWSLAEAQPARRASTNLEERLLHWVASRHETTKLPPSFPATARAPTPFWSAMRAAALIRSGDTSGAIRQIAMLPAKDPYRADLEVSAHLASGRPEQAAAVAGIDLEARGYLLRVLIGTPALEQLAKSGPKDLVRDARFELGIRTGDAGDWKKAASLIERDDPMVARAWRKLGELEAAKGARAGLELARYLDGKDGALFYGMGRPMYRSISGRYDPTRRATEAIAIEATMMRSTERWRALDAYVAWLEKNPRESEARVALAEADATYNRLVNFAGDDMLVWGRYLPKSDLAKRLRAAGKAVRAAP